MVVNKILVLTYWSYYRYYFYQTFQALLAGLIRDSISTRAIQSPEEVINTGKDSEQKVLNDNHSVTSEESSTLGSTPPISGKQEMLPNEDPPASLHSLERTLSYEDDFEEEVDIPLTETAAYKKMMSGGDQQGKSKSREEDSEGDDDLERTLARSISPPIVSPRQRSPSPAKPTASDNSKTRRQKPKLNIFGGNDNLGLSYGTEDLGDSWGGSSGRLSSTGKSDVTDKTVSPPSSPDLEGGYIPTAMEDSQKKTDTAPPKPTTTRKPGFWNNSDTESEVDLQLSTGALDDDDDFDFYG
ncbi:hypothetical protein AC249_AIPGENE11809 [Exaiptasia diaphana]|nr:hypothetical protein AC249_AIPGENE11809 [Exaiptasia diaphana]